MAAFVELSEVSKAFGGLMAVKKVGLKVAQGEILGLIGPNGAGKTTLLNMINGFYKPTQGDIYFRGRPITGLKPNDVCKQGIARTFQVVKPLARLTVLENVMVGAFNSVSQAEAAREIALEYLSLTELVEMQHMPARDLTLSARKRMEVARALATRPKLLLMDEAVAGLNPSETDHMINIIRAIRSRLGITIIIVEHVMRVIMNISDRVAVLHHGEKIAEGTPREVTRDRGVIEAYLGESHA
jgi:branched-chain amino acid transport system ATP-binding protein